MALFTIMNPGTGTVDVYRVTYEALGTAEDPICTIGFSKCHLRRGHDGLCAPIWKMIERVRIELPYRGDA